MREEGCKRSGGRDRGAGARGRRVGAYGEERSWGRPLSLRPKRGGGGLLYLVVVPQYLDDQWHVVYEGGALGGKCRGRELPALSGRVSFRVGCATTFLNFNQPPRRPRLPLRNLEHGVLIGVDRRNQRSGLRPLLRRNRDERGVLCCFYWA